MRKSIYTNIKNRNRFFFNEKQQVILTTLNKQLSKRRYRLKLKINSLVSKTRLKNICFLTGRSRGVSRSLKISRINFRLFTSMGLINGYQKIS